jgi:hypothetical protein
MASWLPENDGSKRKPVASFVCRQTFPGSHTDGPGRNVSSTEERPEAMDRTKAFASKPIFTIDREPRFPNGVRGGGLSGVSSNPYLISDDINSQHGSKAALQ